MNERIKELAKQSGAHWNYGDFNMGTSVEFQEEDLVKFAELIVNRCMDIISEENIKVDPEWRCKDGKHIWWKIAEDFGVK